MRIVAFFSAIAVIILLLAGCGHEKSNNSQVVNLVQLGGVEYPEIPKSNIIQLEKSDFPKGEIRSIERIPIDGREPIFCMYSLCPIIKRLLN